MSGFVSSLFTLVFVICPLVALLFIVRLTVALFSAKVSEQMRNHPWLHLIWGFFAFVGMLAFYGFLNPAAWPPRFVERRAQRQIVLERVQKVGGWEAVRLGCEALLTNHPDGFSWFPPASNVWVYPNPQIEPHRYYVTNFDYGPLPSAVAALRPRAIRYYPRRSWSEEEPQVAIVRIMIFGSHSSGGHSTPYFGLEVVCSTNSKSYRPQPARGGASGNRYEGYRRVIDRVYEIY